MTRLFSANISHYSTTKVQIHEEKLQQSAEKVLALECFIKLEFQHKNKHNKNNKKITN